MAIHFYSYFYYSIHALSCPLWTITVSQGSVGAYTSVTQGKGGHPLTVPDSLWFDLSPLPPKC